LKNGGQRTVSAPLRVMLGGLVVLSGACNHVFYQPDHVARATPKDVGIPYVEHWIESTDGVRLHAWHMAPPEDADKHCRAVVVHFHGNAENMTSHFMFSAWLADAGFDVVTFDYRGYGRSLGTPSREGLFADGNAVLDWVTKEPKLRGLPIVVFGQSLGGAVAVPVAQAQPPGRVTALALDSTFDSYRAVARGKLDRVWFLWAVQVPLSWLVSADLEPAEAIARYDGPLLVAHAVGDPVVDFENGEALFKAATTKDKTFWELETDDHTGVFASEESPYRERFVDWICERVTRAAAKAPRP
jgi:alpha-beta hydrolase superfamily lysophospholipase